MYKLAYTEEARDAIEKLPIKRKRQIKHAIERISANPEIGKRLSHYLEGYCSYRSGDFRIIYKVFREKVTVFVVAVGNRRDVYEKFSRKAEKYRNLSLNESRSRYGKKKQI